MGRGVLLGRTIAARQILWKLLANRVRFTPEERDQASGWRMEAEGTVQPLLTGRVENGVVQKVARPAPRLAALARDWRDGGPLA